MLARCGASIVLNSVELARIRSTPCRSIRQTRAQVGGTRPPIRLSPPICPTSGQLRSTSPSVGRNPAKFGHHARDEVFTACGLEATKSRRHETIWVQSKPGSGQLQGDVAQGMAAQVKSLDGSAVVGEEIHWPATPLIQLLCRARGACL